MLSGEITTAGTNDHHHWNPHEQAQILVIVNARVDRIRSNPLLKGNGDQERLPFALNEAIAETFIQKNGLDQTFDEPSSSSQKCVTFCLFISVGTAPLDPNFDTPACAVVDLRRSRCRTVGGGY
jgi:hypothetical protein